MALARLAKTNSYVQSVVDKAQDYKQPSRLAALGTIAVKSPNNNAGYEYSAGFRLPKVPAIPGVNGQPSQPTQALTSEILSEDHVQSDPELQVGLKLPGLSTEEWQVLTGARKAPRPDQESSSSSKHGRKVKNPKPVATLDLDVTIAPASTGPPGKLRMSNTEGASDQEMQKLMNLGMAAATGKKLSSATALVDGVGAIQSLSAKHKNRLIGDLLNQFDSDKSGTFDQKELMPVMEAVTAEIYPGKKIVITQEDTEFIMKSADHSGDGKLDHAEFIKALDFWDFYCDKKKEIDQVINRYDHDESGQLDKDEFSVLLHDLAKMNKFSEPTHEEVNTMFHMADVNGSGVMDRIEIIHAMTAYCQAKQQQALGNVYHPTLHEWIRQQLEHIFYFVQQLEWHQEVYAEIVKMKPWRQVRKYLEEVTPAALKLSPHNSKGRAQIEKSVNQMIQVFCQNLETKQRHENEHNPWVYHQQQEMDMWEDSSKPKKASKGKDGKSVKAIMN
eukprot:gnl/MRDRNA2_/MRDRNA2_117618_c0_seq1.p1 gnl/MRDRNA2_/MRDRNA2_117618_c0~~gnl/MRDRNA2_/MRDRNA2_117618_c0_seq1.p1  ORF type:complete len:501 (-),score=112.48 gnl/MRDRNA2_/MRDRNA2_117618_c0_seq1:92-1594(-)